MHVLVWGSILIWFVIIPITSTGLFYSTFFRYGGVAYEVLNTADFWFYLPIATVVALFPTIVSRLIALYRNPAYIDFVRLKEKKEGKKLFKRKKIGRRPVSTYGGTLKRSGYAFSHQEGYADLISTGHIFGMDSDHVQAEHFRRRSVLFSKSPSRTGTEAPTLSSDKPASITTAAIAAAASLTTAVVGITNNRSSVTIDVVEAAGSNSRSSSPDATAAEPQTGDSIQREASPSDDSTSHEPTQGVSVLLVQDPPAEETDAALMQPSLRIPGLVDSPDATTTEEDTAVTSGDQEGRNTAETEKAGDSEKVDDLPVV